MPKEFENIVSGVRSSVKGKTNSRTKKPYSEDDVYAIATAQYKEKYGHAPKHEKSLDLDSSMDGVLFKHLMSFEKSETESGEMIYHACASSTSMDRDTEIMEKSALEKGARDLLRNSTVFFNHKHDGLGVGRVKDAYVTDDKMFIDWVPSKAAAVQDVITQINEGILKSMSVAGRVLKDSKSYNSVLKKDIRHILDVELYEVSVVGIPANPDASIVSSIAKAFDDFEKAHLATSANDEDEVVEGDGGELEENHAVLPPNKKPAKDGKTPNDDYYGREKDKEGDKMKCPKCGHEFHDPAESDKEEAVEAKVEHGKTERESKKVDLDDKQNEITAEMPKGPKKSVEEVELEKKVEELEKKVEEIEKKFVVPAGMPAENAFKGEAPAVKEASKISFY